MVTISDFRLAQQEGSCGLFQGLAQACCHPQGVLAWSWAALTPENALLWADDTLVKWEPTWEISAFLLSNASFRYKHVASRFRISEARAWPQRVLVKSHQNRNSPSICMPTGGQQSDLSAASGGAVTSPNCSHHSVGHVGGCRPWQTPLV